MAACLDEMYTCLSRKLRAATSIADLSIFIHRLLTFKQLQYDLLTLLDHYYAVAKAVDSHKSKTKATKHQHMKHPHPHKHKDKDKHTHEHTHDHTETETPAMSSSTCSSTTTQITSTTVTRISIDCDDSYYLLRDLYHTVTPVHAILPRSLLIKLLSYLPRRQYMSLSTVCRHFRQLTHSDAAMLYNASGCSVAMVDDLNLYRRYQHLLLLINFSTGGVQFFPSNHVAQPRLQKFIEDDTMYVQTVQHVRDIVSIPYFAIKQWTLHIVCDDDGDDDGDHVDDDDDQPDTVDIVTADTATPSSSQSNAKPKTKALSAQHFERTIAAHLNGCSTATNTHKQAQSTTNECAEDVLQSIMQRSRQGIACLTLKISLFSRRLHSYGVFSNCKIVQLKDCTFEADDAAQCITPRQFPCLQCLEFDNVSFASDSSMFRRKLVPFYQQLLQTDEVAVLFDAAFESGQIDAAKLEHDDQTQQAPSDVRRFHLLMHKTLKLYQILATYFSQWSLFNDMLHSFREHDEHEHPDEYTRACSLVSLKCATAKSKFTKMVKMLCSCVAHREYYVFRGVDDIERKKCADSEQKKQQRKKESEELKKKKRALLLCGQNVVLSVPPTIEWLFVANIECTVDISACDRLIGMQLTNVQSKQLAFSPHYVVPCVACSIDVPQILSDWECRLNWLFSRLTLTNPAMGWLGIQRPLVRFVFFNGALRPRVTPKLDYYHHGKHLKQILEIEKYGIMHTMVMQLRENRSHRVAGSKKPKTKNTRRDSDYLCMYLHAQETKNLLLQLVTFHLRSSYENDCENWITLLRQKITLYKVWWNEHHVAEWIKDFGRDLQSNRAANEHIVTAKDNL